MKHSRLLAAVTLVLGMAATAPMLAAADWRDVREEHRDLNRDYVQASRQRADMAADRARLNQDIRFGRSAAAARQAADLARDRRAFAADSREIRHDRVDLGHDYRDWR